MSTAYNDVNNVTLDLGDVIELSSYNYPMNTYADSRWFVTSTNGSRIILSFLDFDITFGVSLAIGSGFDFSTKNMLVKIGSPDVLISTNDTMIIKESAVWIWFKTNDPINKDQTRVYFDKGLDFEYDSIPSVSGMKLGIESVSKGKYSATTMTITIYFQHNLIYILYRLIL